MSTYPDNLGYVDAVQVYFTEVTGRAMFFSSRDLALLEAWRERGASAATICKGVREAVRAMPDGDPPRDLHACRSFIEPRVERTDRRLESHREPGGEHGETSSDDSETSGALETDGGHALFERALAHIERAGRQCESDALTRLYREAWQTVREWIEARDKESFDDHERLLALERALVERYFQSLSPTERERIDDQIRDGSERLLERMSEEARREHVVARRRRILVEDYEFVPILE